ncbi:mitochondrial carrier [Punctularia strigosozonata HHB-11173 SS5]|uniref:mitochondrial carrier n=1 Tax=Punctularia strigosozonata (strain HHB-11173) TaxID=741275 RepID=UPI000441631A|nr:mitochondrial carrier [Punctularia strigosozonata HHB-11173 SS5]EIN05712.1 mitochondrial carrier [Punctularia strigosozonata HHB-11173 SS5]
MSTPPAQRKPLPFIANFTAGAIAGISEILTFYPLDVVCTTRANVKTRLQLEKGKAQHGLVGTFKTIIKEEGVGRLYRGLVPPLLMEAPKRATKFAANDFWGKTYLQLTGGTKMTQSLSVLTGCTAGATESFVVVPFELVKIRLQDKSSTYAGPWDVVRQIVKAEGPLGLYAGMEATFWRHVWWNGGFFGSIYQVRALLPKAESKSGEMLHNFASGSVGGFIGTVINTPFDVVKSRIQNTRKVPGVTPKYNWTYPALVTVFREEGFAALYKGFVPKVLRLGPGGGVLLLVVEATLVIFRQALGPPYV